MDRDVRRVIDAVLRRPRLWPTAARAATLHTPRGWWRRGRLRRAEPWIRFRMETAYGTSSAPPSANDVVTWLRWLREWRPARR